MLDDLHIVRSRIYLSHRRSIQSQQDLGQGTLFYHTYKQFMTFYLSIP